MNTNERRCVICNAKLSRYNLGDRCFSHLSEEDPIPNSGIENRIEQEATSTVVPTISYGEPLDLNRISDMVLRLVSREIKIPTEVILSHSRKETTTLARHVTMYLLRADFNWSFGQISRMFDKSDGSASYSGHNRIVTLLESDKELPGFIERIRADYTLSEYPDLRLLEYQSKLFSKQVLEARELRSSLTQKLENFSAAFFSIDVTEREKKIFEMRHGWGECTEATTLEEIGLCYGITRERVRQILNRTWSRVNALKASDIEDSDDLIKILDQIRILDSYLSESV